MSHIIHLKINPARERKILKQRKKQLERDLYNMRFTSLWSPISRKLYTKYQNELNEVEREIVESYTRD